METKALTISTLPVQAREKLTGDARNRLTKIVEQEFSNKASLYHTIQQEERKKIIAAYHKKVGYGKLIKEIENIEKASQSLVAKRKVVAEKIQALGLDENGEPRSDTKYNTGSQRWECDYAAKELNDLLKTIENNGPTENLKNKLLTRITLATTIGEANVIMREVLGNGLIPTLHKEDITV